MLVVPGSWSLHLQDPGWSERLSLLLLSTPSSSPFQWLPHTDLSCPKLVSKDSMFRLNTNTKESLSLFFSSKHSPDQNSLLLLHPHVLDLLRSSWKLYFVNTAFTLQRCQWRGWELPWEPCQWEGLSWCRDLGTACGRRWPAKNHLQSWESPFKNYFWGRVKIACKISES